MKRLQTAQAIQTVVLDKTGTITKGKPELTDVILANGEAGIAGNDAQAELLTLGRLGGKSQ